MEGLWEPQVMMGKFSGVEGGQARGRAHELEQEPADRMCPKQGASWPKDRTLRKLGTKGAEELTKEVENRR